MITTSFFALASFTLAALTPAKVSDVKSNPSEAQAAKAPSIIYVKSFSIDHGTSDTGGNAGSEANQRPRLLGALRGGENNTVIGAHREQQEEATLAKLPGTIQTALIEDLSSSIASAANGDNGHPPKKDSWIITGEVINMDMGNRALQAGVGLGAGQSHLEVRAKVFATSDMNTPFLTFDSKGASGHMPGAAVMKKNPYVAAAKFVMSKAEPDKEARKVARAIANEIGKFMAAQGIPTLQSKK